MIDRGPGLPVVGVEACEPGAGGPSRPFREAFAAPPGTDLDAPFDEAVDRAGSGS